MIVSELWLETRTVGIYVVCTLSRQELKFSCPADPEKERQRSLD